METNEKVEYGKGKVEVQPKEPNVNEVKVNEGLTQDDLLDQKTKIKREDAFTKADAIRE